MSGASVWPPILLIALWAWNAGLLLRDREFGFTAIAGYAVVGTILWWGGFWSPLFR